MALAGASLAARQNCSNVKRYQQKIPKERNWITEKEKMFIEIALGLYENMTCVKMTEKAITNMWRHFHKNEALIREKYPEDLQTELIFGIRLPSSKYSTLGGINFTSKLIAAFSKLNLVLVESS